MSRPAYEPRNGYAACSGCGLCLLTCPLWRLSHDQRRTPLGRAKALQHGARAADIAASVGSCTLCGACEPVCPERIDLTGMVRGLRAELPAVAPLPVGARQAAHADDYVDQGVLLAGQALRANERARRRTIMLLGATPAADDGDDIALALEAGAPVPPARLDAFLAPLRAATEIVVADGLLARHLKRWLPRMRHTGLGVALSSRRQLRRRLRRDDLYVIEPRAFHADHAALVRYYDDLRHETGCEMNLDLQRVAIPATARNLRQRLGVEAPDDVPQTRWLLRGRRIARIVAEDAGDIAALREAAGLPVVHLSELADD